MDAAATNADVDEGHDVLDLVHRLRQEVVDCLPKEVEPTGSEEATGLSAPVLKTCTACRAAKVRCTGDPSEHLCPRCAAKLLECEYPAQKKLGRKKSRDPQTVRIEGFQRQLDRIESLLRQQHDRLVSAPSSSTTRTQPLALPATWFAAVPLVPSLFAPPNTDVANPLASAEASEHDQLWSVLTHPLRLLSLDTDACPHVPVSAASPATAFSMATYASDADPAFDPVDAGLLSSADFERLHQIYMNNMQRYLFLFDPALHTPAFIRQTSPFLATTLALIVAAYCPLSGDLIPGLERHATYLWMRNSIQGFKSIEIVIGYCLWSAWFDAPVSNNPQSDRSWQLMSLAVSCAHELRLDQPLPAGVVEQYRFLTGLSSLSAEVLNRSRQRSQQVVYGLELNMHIQRGRVQIMLPVPGVEGPSSQQLEDPFSQPSDVVPEASLEGYMHVANLAINQLTAKALTQYSLFSAQVGAEGRTEKFNELWKSYFEFWEKRFSRFRLTPSIVRFNRSIVLLSFSLKLAGNAPAYPILEECRATAVQAAQYALDALATDQSIGFAPNTVITDLAYGVNVLIRYSGLCSHSPQLVFDSFTRDLCERVAAMIAMIGAARFNGRSLASVHAERIYALLNLAVSSASPPSFNMDFLASDFSNPLFTSNDAAATPDIGAGFEGLQGTGESLWDHVFASMPLWKAEQPAEGWMPPPAGAQNTMPGSAGPF